MNNYNVKPWQLRLHPSRRLAGFLALTTLLACGMVWLVPAHEALKALVCILLMVAAGYHILRDAWLRLPGSTTALALSAAGILRVRLGDGDWQEAEVRGDSFVTPGLSVVRFRLKESGRIRQAILLPDSGDAETQRALRVWLRWGVQAARAGR